MNCRNKSRLFPKIFNVKVKAERIKPIERVVTSTSNLIKHFNEADELSNLVNAPYKIYARQNPLH